MADPSEMDPSLRAAAEAARGFMPPEEGLALFLAGVDAARSVPGAPLLEVGSYCGKSSIYLGAAAQQCETLLVAIDHHRGSEENQEGWEHHDPDVVDPRTGRMDTLPFFRRTIEEAGLENSVIAVVGDSVTVARHWSTLLGLLFIDGGHALDVAMADYAAWGPHVRVGGLLAIHDVFEHPADGGQAPYEVWCRAVADGFTPAVTAGSLRILRR